MLPLYHKIPYRPFPFLSISSINSKRTNPFYDSMLRFEGAGFGYKLTERNHLISSCKKQARHFDPYVESIKQQHTEGSELKLRINGNGSSQVHPVAEKIVVAVDVDEVLGNFVPALNNFIRDHYGGNYSVSEYHVYEFFKIWNCSRDEANFRVHEFFETPYFKNDIHPIPGSQKALQKLSSFCKLSVVTSRQHVIKDHTIKWIENHYPGLFEEIHFGNHFALSGESKPKSEICKSLGAKILIDDNPKYALECAEIGIKAILFDLENTYPWCKSDTADEHPLVTKVYNWEQVEEKIYPLTVSDSTFI